MKRSSPNLLACLVFIVFCAIALIACEMKTSQNIEKAISDSTQTKQMKISDQKPVKVTDAFEKEKAEVETELNELFEMLQEKEEALIEREVDVARKEAIIADKIAVLKSAEQEFMIIQVSSWTLAVLGLVALLTGFIIAKRGKSGKSAKQVSPKPEAKNVVPKKTATVKKSAPKPKSGNKTKAEKEIKKEDASSKNSEEGFPDKKK